MGYSLPHGRICTKVNIVRIDNTKYQSKNLIMQYWVINIFKHFPENIDISDY